MIESLWEYSLVHYDTLWMIDEEHGFFFTSFYKILEFFHFQGAFIIFLGHFQCAFITFFDASMFYFLKKIIQFF
jgi:hypothetical protein